MTLMMRAGDILQIDFGTLARGERGFIRPAVVVTSDDVLEFRQAAVVVVPCTTTKRGWLTEIEVENFGVVQAHLPTSISVNRIVKSTDANVGPVLLRQIRELIAELLEL
jgi:mRNA-degrading endonuclease toxin of MazEF toxin-antitoxin module